MMGSPEPYQPAIRPWIPATSSSKPAVPAARRVALQDDLQTGQQHDRSSPGPTWRFHPPSPMTGRSGKTASSMMQETPLARKLRAAKPQVRRASRYWASEWSFHPACGSAKPAQTHSRTSSRETCAVGNRGGPPRAGRRGLPGPRGPDQQHGRGPPWPCRQSLPVGGAQRNCVTVTPGGGWTPPCPLVSRGCAAARVDMERYRSRASCGGTLRGNLRSALLLAGCAAAAAGAPEPAAPGSPATRGRRPRGPARPAGRRSGRSRRSCPEGHRGRSTDSWRKASRA